MRCNQRPDKHGAKTANRHSDGNAHKGQNPDLQEIGEEDHLPFGAKGAQGGDCFGLACQKGAHGG